MDQPHPLPPSRSDLPALPISEGVEFRHCPEYPGYCVGDNGSVWSCWKLGSRSHFSDRWRELTGARHSEGYRRVTLSRRKVFRSVLIHRLVLEAFVGPCPDGKECRHLDGDRENNRFVNLAWGTPIENMADMRLHGTRANQVGEQNHYAKLTKEQVEQIRELAREGVRQRGIAAKFGITQLAVSAIVTRKNWGNEQ